jgi:hypothetical protein
VPTGTPSRSESIRNDWYTPTLFVRVRAWRARLRQVASVRRWWLRCSRHSAALRAAVTWQDQVDERPILADLLYIAEHLARKSPGFCANRVFYDVLKPIICETVGWSAKRRCPFGEHIRPIGEIIANKPLEHTEACHAA